MKQKLLFHSVLLFLTCLTGSLFGQAPERIDLFSDKLIKYDQSTVKYMTGEEELGNVKSTLKLRFPYEPVGITYYDLQSNNAVQGRLVMDGSGELSAVWTYAELDNSKAFMDRGTGFNHNDGSGWGPYPTQRPEPARTGWPSANVDSDGNIVVINHFADAVEPYGINMSRWEKSTNTWTTGRIPTNTPYGMLWPRTAMNDDGQTLHVFSLTTPTANNNMIPSEIAGVDGQIVYHRSEDAGATWAVQDMIIPGLDSSEYFQMSGDGYAMDANNGVIAFAYFGMWSDLTVAKSMDNGQTWNTFKVLDYPIDKYVVGDYYDVGQIPTLPDTNGPYGLGDQTDSVNIRAIYTTDRTGSVVVDDNGKVHVFFGAIYVTDGDFNDGAFFNLFNWNGIGYWNEDMMGERPVEIGGSEDTDGDGVLDLSAGDLGDYVLKGTSTFPHAAMGPNGDLYMVYSTAMEEYIGAKDNEYYRHLYGMRSTDGGASWGDPVLIINELLFPDDDLYKFVEAVFPTITVDDDYVHLIYQQDYEPGLTVRPNTSIDDVVENEIAYLRLDKDYLTLVEKVVSPRSFKMGLSPNPADGQTKLSFDLTQDSDITIGVYNLSGQQLSSTDMGNMNAGSHNVSVDVETLTTGLYMVKLNVDNQAATVKLSVK